MRRWETLTALVAVVLASIGSIRVLPGHVIVTIAAVILIAVVGLSRLLTVLNRKDTQPSSFDPAERAKLIREQRDKRR